MVELATARAGHRAAARSGRRGWRTPTSPRTRGGRRRERVERRPSASSRATWPARPGRPAGCSAGSRGRSCGCCWSGTGYNAIARVEGGLPVPGVRVSRDRGDGGALRRRCSPPSRRSTTASSACCGSCWRARPACRRCSPGRAIAAALVGLLQGGIVLACAPLVVPVSPASAGRRGGRAGARGRRRAPLLGLLVAARLRSVENFAGVINVVLFPLLFVSGALYPTAGMPPAAPPARPGQSGHLPGGPDAARVRPAGGVRRPGGTCWCWLA